MKSISYLFRYYIVPFVLFIDPNSEIGIAIRCKKLIEDEASKLTKEQLILNAIDALNQEGKYPTGFQIADRIEHDTNILLGFGTLYLSLDNLIKKGLITGEWVDDGKEKRRRYRLIKGE